jgi:hypothetical protein
MMAADFIDWTDYDPIDPVRLQELIESQRDRGSVFGRATLVIDRLDRSWVCLEGWKAPPANQGPEPTLADLPIGFE